jgi:hypothetical protein
MRLPQVLNFSTLLLMAFQCNKHTHSTCINSKIDLFKNEACSSGASVKEYLFQNQSVFCFDPGLCGGDLATYVLTANCDTLGFLGGIAGNTSINGESFANAEFRGIVWRN